MVLIPTRARQPGGRKIANLPTAADVPTVSVAGDPGVPAVAGAFNSMDGVAEAADSFADTFSGIARRQQTREDTVKRATSIGKFTNEASELVRSWETEGDPSDPNSITDIGQKLKEIKTRYLAEHDGSADSKAMLTARIEGIYSQLSDNAAIRSTSAQLAKVETQLTSDLSNVYAKGGDIEEQFKTADGIIEDYAGALTPEQEITHRSAARKQIVLNEFQGLLARGDVEGARQLFDETPQIASMMGPEEQRTVAGRITSMVKAQDEELNKGRRRVEELKQVLGRDPTMAERVRLAGVGAPEGKQTPTEKVAGIEEALGRPLTPMEKANAIGVDGGAPLTDAGKTIADRERFVDQFGEGSPQVVAFDDASSGGPADLSDEAGIRKEFTALSKSFVVVRDAFKKISSAAEKPSAAGDLALIFNFMKVLDPGSVVRESEFATAESASAWLQEAEGSGTPVPRPIASAIRSMESGQRLSPQQRQDFVGQARGLMGSQLESQRELEQQFTGLAERKRIDPQDVVIDFVGDLGEVPTENGEGKEKTLVLGLDGRPLGGATAEVGDNPAPDTQDIPALPNKPKALPASADKVKDGIWYQGKDGPIIRQNGQWMAPAAKAPDPAARGQGITKY